MVSAAVFEELPSVAVIVAASFDLTVFVMTVKAAVVLPAAMVTDAGTVARDWLLDSEIARPPIGEAELMITVPVLMLPPLTEDGFSVSELSVGA